MLDYTGDLGMPKAMSHYGDLQGLKIHRIHCDLLFRFFERNDRNARYFLLRKKISTSTSETRWNWSWQKKTYTSGRESFADQSIYTTTNHLKWNFRTYDTQNLKQNVRNTALRISQSTSNYTDTECETTRTLLSPNDQTHWTPHTRTFKDRWQKFKALFRHRTAHQARFTFSRQHQLKSIRSLEPKIFQIVARSSH